MSNDYSTFENTIDSINSLLINEFIRKFQDEDGNCSSDRVVKQSMQLKIEAAPGQTIDLQKCKLSINQTIDLSGKKICLDINKLLSNFSSGESNKNLTSSVQATFDKIRNTIGVNPTPASIDKVIISPQEINNLKNFFKSVDTTKIDTVNSLSDITITNEKQQLIKDILDSVFSKLPISILKKSTFVKNLKNAFFNELMNVDTSINSRCSQSILVTQNQNIIMKGPIYCEGSGFEFSQEAIIKNFMKCVTSPILDNVKNNGALKVMFSNPISSDCVYDKILVEPCSSTNKRKFRIDILQPEKEGGSCQYVQNQIIEEDCSITQCVTSEWSEWSPCVEGNQTRTRYVKLQGTNCPTLIETRLCNVQLRSRKNADQPIPSGSQMISYNKEQTNSQNWFVFGLSKMNKPQKYVLFIFLSIIALVWLYSTSY